MTSRNRWSRYKHYESKPSTINGDVNGVQLSATKALRGYEDRIQRYRDKLISQVQAFDGRPFDAAKWFNLYSFDVMGDLAFGISFNMLETSEEHWAMKLLSEGIEPLAWMFPVWFFRVMTTMPLLTRDWWRFIEYCA